MITKRNKFTAIIIPEKDFSTFFEMHPEHLNNMNQIMADYARFRKISGRKPCNNYIIVNQDEPYAEEVWMTILRGEEAKLQ
jgi:diadenosine tetraphosphate (Ap4A) HIT family hydrolase